MKAVLAHVLGDPETFRIEETPDIAPGPGRVAIAIHAAGISFVDVLVASGGYQVKPPVPFIPGGECAGVVEAVGEGVTAFKPGDRVCGSGFGGAFATRAVVPAGSVLAIPDDMPFDEASVFRVSYATAYHGLVQRARLQAGETVLVLGAGGAVGAAAIQVARALGARVIGSASSQAKRDLAVAAGAETAIDSRAQDWRDQIKALTGGKGVDVVIDPVGGEATEPAFRSLAWNGRHLIIGFAAGGIARLPTNLPLLKGGALIGVDLRQLHEREPEVAADNLKQLFALGAGGGLRPTIARRLPLEQFAEAMRIVASGESAGRVVLQVRP